MADQGIGFLSGRLFASAPDSQINEAEGAEESSEDTAGTPGMGRVINGIDAGTEKALYKDLRAAYWAENWVRHIVAIAVAGAGLVLSTHGNEITTAIYALLTLIVTVTYLKGH